MATKRKQVIGDAAKVREYERVLHAIASWSDGAVLAYLDEPGAADEARKVLQKMGAT